MPVHKHVPPYSSAGGGPSLNGETMQVPPLPASGMLSGRWPLSLAATVTLPRRRLAGASRVRCVSARVALVPGPSAHTLLLQALANLPEMSPKQPIVNKNQLAILSMWICGIPC
jgi:hypothetical protein